MWKTDTLDISVQCLYRSYFAFLKIQLTVVEDTRSYYAFQCRYLSVSSIISSLDFNVSFEIRIQHQQSRRIRLFNIRTGAVERSHVWLIQNMQLWLKHCLPAAARLSFLEAMDCHLRTHQQEDLVCNFWMTSWLTWSAAGPRGQGSTVEWFF